MPPVSSTRPSVTVNEALFAALPHGSRIVAGRAGRHERITGVQVLRGRPVSLAAVERGELVVFSAGAAAMLGGERGLGRLLQDLAEAGAAAFAAMQLPSTEMAETANTRGTPLILLPAGASSGEVERSVLSLLLDREEQVRRRVAAVYERLLDTLIEQDGAGSLAREVQGATGKATYVFDPFLQLLGAASEGVSEHVPTLRKRLSALVTGNAAQTTFTTRMPVLELSKTTSALIRTLELRGTAAGFLCLLGRADEFWTLDERIVERAASVLAIETAKQRAVAEARFRLQSDFLDELLDGAFVHAETIAARARSIGYDLERPHAVFILEAIPDRHGAETNAVRQRFADAVRYDLLRTDPAALIRGRHGRVDVLKPLSDVPGTSVPAVVEALRRRLCETFGGMPVAAGIGRSPAAVGQFPTAHREAALALEVAQALLGGNTSLRFQDLGVERLLLQLLGNPELAAFRQDTIGLVEAYDERHGTELARTLEVFLACHGNYVRAAKQLHLHRNTLLYRLHRAHEILGRDLDDPDIRLAVQMALKLRHLPQEAWRPPVPPSTRSDRRLPPSDLVQKTSEGGTT